MQKASIAAFKLKFGEAPDFGMSVYLSSGDKDNCLSYDPEPPSQPGQIASEWFQFEVTGLGSDSIGSFLDLSVSLVALVDPGDFNEDGDLGAADIDLFRDFWQTSTAGLSKSDQFLRGDMDFNGLVDIDDLGLLAQAFADRNVAFSFSIQAVPEPTSLGLLGHLALTLLRRPIAGSGARRGI